MGIPFVMHECIDTYAKRIKTLSHLARTTATGLHAGFGIILAYKSWMRKGGELETGLFHEQASSFYKEGSAHMLAARFYGHGQPLRVEEVPAPVLGPLDAMVRIRSCGICGSDIHIVFDNTTKTACLPITLGHEVAGDVVEVGPGTSSHWLGKRVIVVPDIGCGECVNCIKGHIELCVDRKMIGIHRDGGLAELIRVPSGNLVAIPDSISYDEAAISTDALATPYHAISQVAHFKSGRSAAVIGTGALAYHAVKILKALGASTILAYGHHANSLQRMLECGAQRGTFELGDGDAFSRKIDFVFDFQGTTESSRTAFNLVRPGGKIVLIGLGSGDLDLPINPIVRSGIQILGAYGANCGDLRELFALIQEGRLDVTASVSSTYSLNDVNLALEHSRSKKNNPIRIVVHPSD